MKEQHINPAEAVQIHQDLNAKRSVGVHWGTFALTDEPLDQPPKDLAAARQAANISDDDFFLMAIGETRRIDRRSTR
jgi:N-acyl-phosphatidylethanolamine-hydrolysing phospholipase D